MQIFATHSAEALATETLMGGSPELRDGGPRDPLDSENLE
jgi:hypothetical protein